MSGEGNKRLWIKDTIAGVILGCVACIFVQTQLQALADRLHSPAISAALRWWPVILVVAGLALLRKNKSDLDPARELESRPQEVANERRQSRNNAA